MRTSSASAATSRSPGASRSWACARSAAVRRGPFQHARRSTVPASTWTSGTWIRPPGAPTTWTAGATGGPARWAGELQADTSYVIPADVPAAARLEVRAADENLYRYLADERVGRSGIDRGYGVFGAVAFAEALVPGS